jgi:signal transduction histidine kinase/CheY-like chemotaxis protein
MTLSICFVVLMIASTVFVGGTILIYSNNVARDLQSFANTIGYNSRAAVIFQDQEGAEAILATLEQQPDIDTTRIFKEPGKVFAQYVNPRLESNRQIDDYSHASLITEAFDGHQGYTTHLLDGHVHVYAPIRLENDIIGAIVIQSRLSAVYATFWTNVVIAIVAILFCIPISILCSNKIQGVISEPILHLLGTMKLISEEGNYALRAKKYQNDELGKLTDGFNEMLAQINARDKEVLEARSDAEAAEKAKDERTRFLASMSHEIRTPINGVIGLADLLEDTDLDERQHSYVTNLNRSGKVLLTLINDILDFSKIEAGKLELDPVFFDIYDMVENVIALFSESARDKNNDLCYSISDSISTRFLGDSHRIGQVLINILGNAIKFTECGEITVRITTMEDSEKSSWVKFEILDTGIGIEEANQEAIFDPFTQTDGSTTRRYGGTGLGLAISRQIVELMGGEIGLESSLGKGSRFWFKLRLQKDTQNIPRLTALSGLNALILSECHNSSEILQERLTSWGVNCTSTSDRRHALEIFRASSGYEYLDIVILDLGTSDWQSPEHMRCISETSKDTRIVALSFVPNLEQKPEWRALGIDSCLLKPTLHSSLYKEIGKLTGRESEDLCIRSIADQRKRETLAFDGVRILVAEDNPVNQLVAVNTLESLGCKVLVAENGRAALKVMMHVPVDLVLMDCFMPEMDGFEATRDFRRWSQDRKSSGRLPIVALTANAMKGDRELCLASGMDDYLTKPFTKEQLSEILKSWLPKSGADPNLEAEEAVGDSVEQRLATRMLNYWTGLRGGRSLPSRQQLDLNQFPELQDHFFAIDLAETIPVYRHIGTALKVDIDCELFGRPITETPPGTMLGWIAELNNRKPVTFEFSFIDTQSCEVKARSIMLPFSDGEVSVEYILGAISFKKSSLSLETIEQSAVGS